MWKESDGDPGENTRTHAAAINAYQDIPRGSLLTGCLAETGHPPSSTGATLKEHQEVAGLCWPVSKKRSAHKVSCQSCQEGRWARVLQKVGGHGSRTGVWSQGQFTRMFLGGWRVGSEAKSTCCSYAGPRFGSQHRHRGSQPFVTLFPENLTPYSGL